MGAGVPQRPSGAPLSRAAPNLTLSSPISFLHPNVGKKSKYKTSVRKKTLNPEFNEVGQDWAQAVPAALWWGRAAPCLGRKPQVPADTSLTILSLFLKWRTARAASLLSVSVPAGVLVRRPEGGAGEEDTAGVRVGL